MRIKVTLNFDHVLKLPISYNHIIQAFLLKNISSELADFLHNQGYVYQNRVFKQFVFSNLFGKYQIEMPNIFFQDEVCFWVASPISDFLSQFAESLFKKELELCGQKVVVSSVEIKKLEIKEPKIKIKMLSPMTVYSTLTNGDKKKTYYYSPFEADFTELISENLRKKYLAFYPDAETNNFEFKIRPINVQRYHEKIVKYKDFIIKGWLGNYELTGSLEVLNFATEAGLGSKNSQGFGCFEIINNE
ncbi:MAG: CRISPR-associated endoribonuclease Cas6 [Candidatus Margulisiibacteriota bacterium]|jgi:CRISPR-associated endoribonuclease Cas6